MNGFAKIRFFFHLYINIAFFSSHNQQYRNTKTEQTKINRSVLSIIITDFRKQTAYLHRQNTTNQQIKNILIKVKETTPRRKILFHTISVNRVLPDEESYLQSNLQNE